MSPLRRIAAGVIAAVSVLSLSACASLDGLGSAKAAPTQATAKPVVDPLKSTFTTEGVYQSHIEIRGVDFVYTIWPSKRTPIATQWYPGGNKFFNITLQAYDLERGLRSKFSTKRKVYVDTVRIAAQTVTSSGATESPFSLFGKAKRFTFDPEAVTTKYGMLVTSPKGSFELRNRRIGALARDTRGLNFTFEAEVYIQREAGSKKYASEIVRHTVPIGIIDSDAATVTKTVPANSF